MSGNYRPFREPADSYKKTGIPCGNPRRCESRSVIKMGPPARGRHGDHQEIVLEDIETEADRQLQVLLKRQLDTNVTLDDQLAKKKAFTEPVILDVLEPKVAGTRSLDEFKCKETETNRLDELRQYGLTEDEILLKLRTEKTETSKQMTGYGADPEAIAAKLRAIDEKIKAHKQMLSQPIRFGHVKTMTRHEMELEMAISHDKEKAKLLGSLLVEGRTSDPSYNDANHPINHLDSILKEALERRQQQADKEKYHRTIKSDTLDENSIATSQHVSSELAADDGRELEPMPEATCQPKPKPLKRTQKYVYLPEDSEGDSSPVTNLKISESAGTDNVRKLSGNIEIIPEEAISRYKLSISDIKKLDHFSDYEPGTPNKTIFLKNLSSKVTEVDLVSIFHRFQRPDLPIQYRLMSGRMRGQAFISLDSVETATKALKLVNGYHFKGKPIIIQYGKH